MNKRNTAAGFNEFSVFMLKRAENICPSVVMELSVKIFVQVFYLFPKFVLQFS